jgi:hypothetical protein
MASPHALVIGFFLLVGLPCLFFPRWMQWFVLAANERLGYVEPPSGFRRTPQYLRRLRLIGAVCVLVALLLAFFTLWIALAGMDWVSPIGRAAVTVMSIVFLFEGTRRIALFGIHRGAFLFVVPGILVCALYGGSSYWKHTIFAGAETTVRDRPELPDDWGRGLTPHKRRDDSLRYARLVFVTTGELRTYFTTSGNRTRYAPTEEEIQKRTDRVATDQFLRTAARDNLVDSVVWLVTLLLAPIFGYAVAIGQRRTMSPNSTAEPDARKSGARRSP